MRYCIPTTFEWKVKSCILKVRIHIKPIDNIEKYLIGIMAEEFDITEKMILSSNRCREAVTARMFLIKLLRIYTKYTKSRIGKLFNRDHSTVIYALNTFEDLCETEMAFRERFGKIYERVDNVLGESLVELIS